MTCQVVFETGYHRFEADGGVNANEDCKPNTEIRAIADTNK